MKGFMKKVLGGRKKKYRKVDPLGLAVKLGEAVKDKDLPKCSIVILNWNGKHHLEPCFETLRDLDYPSDKYEVVLVDNGSTDGSLEEMREEHSWVKLVENAENAGFSKGCNQGVKASSSPEVVVFLNNDMRVEEAWLRELVSPIARGECAATTAKMYSWDGKLMNSAGGGMNFHGIGIQRGYLEDPGPEYDWARKTLFACGGAMAMDAQIYEDLNGFDEEFFAYYEDVDLGWRTWIAGHEVIYTPKAVCYHHHSSTSKRLPSEMIRLLQVRNPILVCFKNYGEEAFGKAFPALLALAVRRMFACAGIEDDSAFRIERAQTDTTGPVRKMWERARGGAETTYPLTRIATADLIGLNDLLGDWDHWMERRREVQATRERSDEEIFRLFLKPNWCVENEAGYQELHHGLMKDLGIAELFDGLTDAGPEPHK
jgi:GT2 family glycosyltransferase